MPAPREKTKTVVFTEATADQALLTKAERLVRIGKYPSFGALCKQALEDFLAPPAPEATEVPALEMPVPVTAGAALALDLSPLQESLSQHFGSLEQKLSQVQSLVERLEQQSATAEEANEGEESTLPFLTEHFSTVEQRLVQLQVLVERLDQQTQVAPEAPAAQKLENEHESIQPNPILAGLRELIEEF
ncbi:hypothetical protein [Leptolyngbya sp. FACHB-261]|uniref:hypothetical protein n=1 Tax=Leptolyngbya sp. FACHB-261 TaxID=2692806 RepID=UPI001686B950|nr:hypothetical protein [Leptolyngbya sp. FACHB-261]MBD2102071.1 hypothetical protein [Leptolyngbya sp. FACHB-261]